MSVSAQIRIRRDTAANFTSANPTLALGEIAFETDTRNFKVGDGTTAWTSLPYATNYRGNAVAGTTNTTIGQDAGKSLSSLATSATAIGRRAGEDSTSGGFTAVGHQALANMNSGVVFFGTIVGGTGGLSGGSGTVSNVTLEKASGVGEMAVYPTVNLTIVSGTVTAVSLVAGGAGSGCTVQSGLVFKANAAGIAAGAPADFTVALGTATINDAFGDRALENLTSGYYNTAVGLGAGRFFNGTHSVAIGQGALGNTTTGDFNIAIGYNTLSNFTGLGRNVAVGANCLAVPSSGTGNTAVGIQALRLSTASDLTAVGAFALDANTTGTQNTVVGRDALGAATTAIGTFTTAPVAAGSGYTANQTGVTVTLVRKSGTDTFTGTVQAALTTNASGAVTAVTATPVSAGSTFTGTNVIFEPSGFGGGSGCEISIATLASASSNTAVGHQAGLSLTTASSCTLVGANAGDALTTGAANTLIGRNAGGAMMSGSDSVIIGNAAGAAISTASENTIVGADSCSNATGGQNCTLGRYTLFNLVGGTNNIAVGVNAGFNLGAGGAAASGSNTIIGGNAGRYRGSGTDTLTRASDSVFIGASSRANDNSQTNQVVIAGTNGLGDGSNTTVIGNTSTTSTRIPAGRFTVSSTEASTSTTTGALVVGGGAGIAGNLSMSTYTEGVVAIGTIGVAGHTFVLTNGTVQTATLTDNEASAFTMPTAVAGKSFTLFLKQAATTGNGTATFTGVKWNATTPVMTATAGKMDIFSFVSDGTNWYGSVIQGFTP